MTAAPHVVSGVRVRRRLSGAVRATLVAARPRQWTKNGVVFAGVVFAGKATDLGAWGGAASAFAAFCALSAGAYLVNDVRDRHADALHPVKRLRPVASGALSPSRALGVATVLVVAGVAGAATLGGRTAVFAAAFLALQLAYSFELKRVAFLDLLVIASLFDIRAAAGAAAVHVHVSDWLLACTALLAVYLGLAKRRGELVLVESGRAPGRPALAGYGRPSIDRLLDVTGVAAAVAYLVYSVTAHDAWELILTTPFVWLGLARYRWLVHRYGLGEEPESVLLRDRWILLAVVAWAGCAGAVLASA